MAELAAHETAEQTDGAAALTLPALLDEARRQLAAAGIDLTEDQIMKAALVGGAMQAALCFAAGRPIQSPDELPESSGYAPLLIENGWNPGWARAAAALAVRHGRRRVEESRWIRRVCAAVRFLAQPGRRRDSIHRRAALLLYISERSTAVETIFCQAGLTEHEFLGLLKAVVEGRDVDLARVALIAAELAPDLSVVRGPKVTVASAAHEFLLDNGLEVAPTRARYARADRPDQYGDAVTRATRRESGNPNYDGRPVRRRIVARSEGAKPQRANRIN
jgi:hypothetical protein